MREEVMSVNELYKYRLPALAAELPGARVALFRSFDLVRPVS